MEIFSEFIISLHYASAFSSLDWILIATQNGNRRSSNNNNSQVKSSQKPPPSPEAEEAEEGAPSSLQD